MNSLCSPQDKYAFQTQRLHKAQAEVQRLERNLQAQNQMQNSHLREIWQRELTYWRKEAADTTAKLERFDTYANLA